MKEYSELGWVCFQDELTSCPSGIYQRLVLWLQCTDVEKRRLQSCIHFMNLKKLNRLAHMRLKKGRDQTHDVMPADPPPPYVPWHGRLRDGFITSFCRFFLLSGEAKGGRVASSAAEPAVRGHAPAEGDQQVSGVQVSILTYFTVWSRVCFIVFLFITARNPPKSINILAIYYLKIPV